MPTAGGLGANVQLTGDLNLEAPLGKQLSGAFPARRPLLGASPSCLLLATVGSHAGMLPRHSPSSHRKVKGSIYRRGVEPEREGEPLDVGDVISRYLT
jgi:hypothetical protein